MKTMGHIDRTTIHITKLKVLLGCKKGDSSCAVKSSAPCSAFRSGQCVGRKAPLFPTLNSIHEAYGVTSTFLEAGPLSTYLHRLTGKFLRLQERPLHMGIGNSGIQTTRRYVSVALSARSTSQQRLPGPKNNRVATLCMVLTLLAGCTTTSFPVADKEAVDDEQFTQEAFAFKTLIDRQGKVNDLAFPILVANTELCGSKVKPHIGISWFTQKDYVFNTGRLESGVISFFGIGKRPSIIHVTAGSPAEDAGLMQGDVITSVDGNAVPVGRFLNPRGRFVKQLDEAAVDGVVNIVYERGVQTFSTSVKTIPACDYPVRLLAEDQINAFANGRTISLAMGLYRFASDLELQSTIAHELAHNTEGHPYKKFGYGLIGGFFDVAAFLYWDVFSHGLFAKATSERFSQNFEREADYIAMYMLERAGIDGAKASNYWRKLAMEHPDTVFRSWSHPTSPERFVNFDNAYKEIVRKRESGEPMVPTRK